MTQAAFEEFVARELGDVAVKDNGRYISPKIQNYWKTWEAAQAREVEWRGEDGTQHFMPLHAMIADMKALYDEWPGGRDELEASQQGWRRVAIRYEGALLEIARLTCDHDAENDKAVVYANKLGEVLERAVPGWQWGGREEAHAKLAEAFLPPATTKGDGR